MRVPEHFGRLGAVNIPNMYTNNLFFGKLFIFKRVDRANSWDYDTVPGTALHTMSYEGASKKKVVSVHIWQVHWPEPAEMIRRPRRQQKR